MIVPEPEREFVPDVPGSYFEQNPQTLLELTGFPPANLAGQWKAECQGAGL
jgi:hypothetical protein